MGINFKNTGEALPVQTKGQNVNLTLKSRNKKTGNIPVSTSGKHTCPNACPLKASGACYAMGGPLGMFWTKVSKNEAGTKYQYFLDQVEALQENQLWRHNQSGDLEPSEANPDHIDLNKLMDLVKANTGKRGFTFSHYDPIKHPVNSYALSAANNNGFTINLSGNTVEHADELADLEIGPVVSIVPIEYERRTKKTEAGKVWAECQDEYKTRLKSLPGITPKGRKLVVCPATYSDNVSCKTCGLCQKSTRKSIVAFPAHGTSRRKADAIATGEAIS